MKERIVLLEFDMNKKKGIQPVPHPPQKVPGKPWQDGTRRKTGKGRAGPGRKQANYGHEFASRTFASPITCHHDRPTAKRITRHGALRGQSRPELTTTS